MKIIPKENNPEFLSNGFDNYEEKKKMIEMQI